jgi:hypothetical protein
VEVEVEARRETRMGHTVQIRPPSATISRTARPRKRVWRLFRDGGVGAAAREEGSKVGVAGVRGREGRLRFL